ncbi:hypothetical protein EHN07_05360 [Buttiauxella warmboldiae]|uniref:Uncharacterized protein n=1 Tax=Buttiauxella warmboldiae TaxID=82993 RepID=A0A3N5ED51_9ENTR|nr:hypothetical protein [Buttiauxella warmboldiae]RPH29636.1 hypothetical protein EHN07_05360 [Buttiauxella warmboldiae]
MRQERTLRIRAFRRALELGAGERAEECRHFHRWKMELRNFPHGSCDLASNTLAQYLTDTEGGHPCIIFMEGNAGFQEAENSTVHGHVIVLLDGEYTDLTLDQFEEYPDYIPSEPVESGGPLGKLLRNIMKHEDHVQTRQVDLDGGEELYAWLRDTANEVLAADPEWQAWEQSIAEQREAALKLFPFQSNMQKIECEQGQDSQEVAR